MTLHPEITVTGSTLDDAKRRAQQEIARQRQRGFELVKAHWPAGKFEVRLTFIEGDIE